MANRKAQDGTNRPRLTLHVPEPKFRPGDKVDFSHVPLTEPGAQPRPDETCPASETFPLCSDMIRTPTLHSKTLSQMTRATRSGPA